MKPSQLARRLSLGILLVLAGGVVGTIVGGCLGSIIGLVLAGRDRSIHGGGVLISMLTMLGATVGLVVGIIGGVVAGARMGMRDRPPSGHGPSDRADHDVGPDHLRLRAAAAPGGRLIASADDLGRWVEENRSAATPDGLVPATFGIDSGGLLRLADRRSEHVACGAGGPVRSAGEMFFAAIAGGVEVAEVTNLSTGFCPEPESWGAVREALDRIGVRHPGRFTTCFLFRRCPVCGRRNAVKEGVFECPVCGSELPSEWNFA